MRLSFNKFEHILLNNKPIAIWCRTDIKLLKRALVLGSDKDEDLLWKKNIANTNIFYRFFKTLFFIPKTLKYASSVKEFLKLIFIVFNFFKFKNEKILSVCYHDRNFHKISIILSQYSPVGIMFVFGQFKNEERVFGSNWNTFVLKKLLVPGEWFRREIISKGSKIAQYSQIGAIRNAVYEIESRNIANSYKKYDLCIVSSLKKIPDNDKEYVKPTLELYAEIALIARRLNLKVCFASTVPDDAPMHSVIKKKILQVFDGQIDYFPMSNWSTYQLTDNSEVSYGAHSSALLETFYRGNKVISHNPTQLPNYDFPVDGFWNIKKDSRKYFGNKFESIRAMSQEEWDEISLKTRHDLIKNDSPSQILKSFYNCIED